MTTPQTPVTARQRLRALGVFVLKAWLVFLWLAALTFGSRLLSGDFPFVGFTILAALAWVAWEFGGGKRVWRWLVSHFEGL